MVNENEKSEIDKHFVSEGIEKGAEVGDDMGAAGPATVDKISERGDDKADDGSDVSGGAVRQHERDEWHD